MLIIAQLNKIFKPCDALWQNFRIIFIFATSCLHLRNHRKVDVQHHGNNNDVLPPNERRRIMNVSTRNFLKFMLNINWG